ncbi:NAD(P)/FAD-dependent oxidoreductase [Protofrankia symbiont of Coriaria ruscifolia]|uniref:NAD(P)/FAD-dependent oxidoreductase n=1 Tax=Protofrankia symbiont of Coriaria ruscifolia TaxID=1306542 RepID=UPI001F5E49E7|nr:FAD-dependent oxidoreductase [Protofrankia symbiont of Coriaria ruscifolia]
MTDDVHSTWFYRVRKATAPWSPGGDTAVSRTADSPGRARARPRVVVVGSGFGGFGVLSHLERRLPADAVELVVVSPVDHLLYTSLLPQVSANEAEPRHLAVSIRAALRRTTLHLGHVVAVDAAGGAGAADGTDAGGGTVTIRRPDGFREKLHWDRLVLAPGAVTRTFDIPGLTDHALGLKNLAEAVYLRDHVLRQLEYADACDDPAERRARCTFVVIGAGYTGTELAAQMTQFTRRAVYQYPRLAEGDIRWILADLAPRVLPELRTALGDRAARVLAARGVEVRLRTSVAEVSADSVRFTTGEIVATHTLVWCAGVSPSPLVATLGLPTTRQGRLVVDAQFRVPDVAGMFALGDAAAVPDVTQGCQPAGQTAQHAVRQAAAAARSVAASLGYATARPYRHRNLGFIVDLGGTAAVADPLGVPLSGVPAAALTRMYHLRALPCLTNKTRVAADWLLGAFTPRQIVQLGFLPPAKSSISAAERTDIYTGSGAR